MDLLQHLLLGGSSGGGGAVSVDPLSVVENGVYTAPSGKAYSPVTVNVPQGGGGGVAAKDVNFLDYDGTIVAAYSAADFAALDALPANPSHDGLTAQGWNWTLSDAKSYVAAYGKLEIGQMYITHDGKTRLYIEITDILRNDVPIFFGQSVANGVTVDWGDGSAPETFAGTTNVSVSHVYAATGKYIITLDPADGCTLNLGSTSASAGTCVMGVTGSNFFVYANMLRAVEVGRNVTAIRNSALYSCRLLQSVAIQDGVTAIGNSALYQCGSLQTITIPSSVTSIGSSAFYYCSGLISMKFMSSTPPTVASSNAFVNMRSDCKIYVPAGSLEAYTTATNYPNSSTYTYVEY